MRKLFRQLVSGLRARLLLLVVLTSAPLVGLTLHTASEERRQLVQSWKARSQAMTQMAIREEQQMIGQTHQLLVALAESAALRAGNRLDGKKLLDAVFGSYAQYANLGVVATNGELLASARSIPATSNPAKTTVFQRTIRTRALAIGNFAERTANAGRTLDFGYPVFDFNGAMQAVVVATLDLDWVSRFASALPMQLPPGATWTEVDRSGRILFRYPVPEPGSADAFPESTLLATMFQRQQGTLAAPTAARLTGYFVFASRSSQLFSNQVVTVLSSVPKQSLFRDANRRLLVNVIGLGVAAGFAFLLAWMGSTLLVLRPVRALVQSNARLAAGDLGTRTGLPARGDELGQLSRTFDQMAQTLEQREGERRVADQALRASEIRYRRLFETAQDGILILNAETGQIDDVNPFLTNLLGYTRAQLLGNKLWEIGPFKDTQASKAGFRTLQVEGCVRYDDLPLETKAGKSVSVEFVSNVYQANGDKVIQCNIRDISERKQAEAKRKVYNRKLEVLSRRLVEAQETERRNLARELHDEIGQALTAIQLNLQAMLQLPAAESLKPRLQESHQVVERVLEQVHDISLNLRPSILDDLGLAPALRWYTERQATLLGLQAEVHVEALEQRLDSVIETACFRVAQEALTNVVRHAHAKTVTVELSQDAGRLHLRVRDDGVGFEVGPMREQALRGTSLGLLNMEERAVLAGGALELISIPRRGTEVHAWFPLTWQIPPGGEEPA